LIYGYEDRRGINTVLDQAGIFNGNIEDLFIKYDKKLSETEKLNVIYEIFGTTDDVIVSGLNGHVDFTKQTQFLKMTYRKKMGKNELGIGIQYMLSPYDAPISLDMNQTYKDNTGNIIVTDDLQMYEAVFRYKINF
jgi:hypothetical protein